jgi:molybdopterin molybdotransferase
MLGTEPVKLELSLGRVLAEDVLANRDIPPYDVSAMDGYAVRSADLEKLPATLEIIEDIKAGDMPIKTVRTGQCARIMTGAPMPDGGDAVIRVEDTQEVSAETLSPNSLPQAGERDEVSLREFIANAVQINRSAKSGHDVRTRGESMRKGEAVLTAGTEITPGVIGVLATVKCAQVQVYRHPRVAILSTGNELEDIDEPVDPTKIPNSNSYALMAQVQALGIEPSLLGIRRRPTSWRAICGAGWNTTCCWSPAAPVGVLIIRPTIEALGAQMLFWRGDETGHRSRSAKSAKIILVYPAIRSQHGLLRGVCRAALRRMMVHAHPSPHPLGG